MSKIKFLNNKIFLFLAILLLFSSCYFMPNNNFISNTEFVEGSQDIPLAQGLTKIGENAFSFDSTSGNIISISYKSTKDLEEIKDFYLKTLPQIGWQEVKYNKATSINSIDFKRNNEKLEIEFISEEKKNLVKFFAELGV